MSYFETSKIAAADGPSIDAFGRWRVSGITTLFDSKQLHDTGSINWATKIIGNATCSYVQDLASVKMITSGSNSSVIRQSRRRFNYQPGKSQLIVCTGNFGSHSHANCIERIGYFDERDGLFFEVSGSTLNTAVRSGGTTTYVSQSNWNLDTFNGRGVSGNTIDISKSQIYFFDFEWLGVGRVRYGIFQGGIPYYVNQITNINALTEEECVYMQTPNLPVRYEIINSGSSNGTLYHICSAVASEGGIERNGPYRSIDIPGQGTLTINNGVYAAALAIRLKPGYLDTTVIPINISMDNNAGNNGWKWTLLLNPTTGSAFTWADLRDSAVQWATGSNSITIIDEGIKIVSGYVTPTADTATVTFNNDPSLSIGSSIDGASDTLVLAISNFGLNTTFRTAMQFQETI